MPNLTDLSTIRDVCARHDFALSKGFGQNFIINPGICPRIAEAAGIGPGWGALEVGPGIGVLTEQLCKRADKVVSIEVDKRLPPILAETMAEYENFKLVLEDVLKVDLRTLLAEEFGDKPVAVCANLPYYITSPILMRLLEEKLPIRNITVMVQKEAAQRLCAAPGTREAGAISYAVAYYARPKLLFTVQPGSFYPAPKVTSAVIQLDVHTTPPVTPPNGDEAGLFRLIRAAFSQRRKTAANAVANTTTTFLNIPANAVGMAALTVVGQCLGAGEKEQAVYYSRRLLLTAYCGAWVMNLSAFLFANRFAISLFNLSPEAQTMALQVMVWFNFVSLFFWPSSFTLPNILRAAGDARFTMAVSILSMWVFRVGFCYVMVLGFHGRLLSIWMGMFLDWVFRSLCFFVRFARGRWMEQSVI